MIRLIASETDAGQAANVGGPVSVRHKTFDIHIPELEAWINEPLEKKWGYIERRFEGIEILPVNNAS
jgi:hypothetical protein